MNKFIKKTSYLHSAFYALSILIFAEGIFMEGGSGFLGIIILLATITGILSTVYLIKEKAFDKLLVTLAIVIAIIIMCLYGSLY